MTDPVHVHIQAHNHPEFMGRCVVLTAGCDIEELFIREPLPAIQTPEDIRNEVDFLLKQYKSQLTKKQ